MLMAGHHTRWMFHVKRAGESVWIYAGIGDNAGQALVVARFSGAGALDGAPRVGYRNRMPPMYAGF